MEVLEIPKELRDQENVLKLLTIVFPCTVKHVEPKVYRNERLKLISIFRENCAKKRLEFFREPLIQHLWSKVFMEANPDIINVHLRRIKSERADGDVAMAKLIKSIQ